MSDPSTGITLRTIQEAMPEYHIATDLLDGVLTAMPPPPPDASPAWRRARLTRVIEEVAARVPMDAAQGHLAGQLVVVEFLADDMLGRITMPGLALAERRLVSRTADNLLRSVVRLERALERRQARVMPFRDVGAVAGFDLDALDGVWCRGPPRRNPGTAGRTGADRGAAPQTPEPAGPARARRAVGLGCGCPQLHGEVGRFRAERQMLQQGDGCCWRSRPARRAPALGCDLAAHAELPPPIVTAGAATAGAVTADRQATRGCGMSASVDPREAAAAGGLRRGGCSARVGRIPGAGAGVWGADAGRGSSVPRVGDGERTVPCMHGGASTGPRTAAGLVPVTALLQRRRTAATR